MKKIICSIFILASVMLVLTSCIKFTCDVCGEENRGKKHSVEFMGETGVLCEDCYDQWQAMMDELEGLEPEFTCDVCMRQKSGEKHEIETGYTVVVLCDDCYEEMQDELEGLE